MKHPILKIAIAAAVLASAMLAWRYAAKPEKTPPPVVRQDKEEAARLARIARHKKDGITSAPTKPETHRKEEEKFYTQKARPARGISLLALDLTRPPTEAELVSAGQLRGPLSPTAPADPAGFADPSARAWQENDNLLFGRAIQAWNESKFNEALALFQRHAEEHSQSPWAAESRLHLAMAAKDRKSYTEAHQQADIILKDTPKGTDVYQKASLLKADTMVKEGRHEEAAVTYLETMRSETNGDRKKLASGWLTTLSQYRRNKS